MLSEEQAIEKLKKIRQDTINANECGLSNNDFKEEIEVYDMVLNIIDRLQKENEENKYLYQKALGDVVSADKENIELKKQIDLMAEFINKQDIDEEICKNNISDLCDEFGTGINCIKCIKQYFEGKAKEMRNNEFCSQRNYTLWRMW